MIESENLFGQVLFNFLIILTPIFFYQWIFLNPKKTIVQILAGLSFGLASITSMEFPIIYGDYGGLFLGDLRWVPFVICVLYLGKLSGAICGVLLIAYRFFLGGMVASIIVLVMGIILFTAFLLVRKKYIKLNNIQKYLFNIVSALFTFFIVIVAIWTHFFYLNQLDIFYEQGIKLYVEMGISYFLSMIIYTYFTESTIHNLKLVEQINKAEKLNIVSELAASIAHEIRNPLTVVRGFIQIAKMKVDHTLEGYMNTAINELDRAETIISNYLNFARPHQEERSEVFNISETIYEIILLMESYANIKGIKLDSKIETELYIEGDLLKFKQALLNIVKNAIEATEKGSVTVSASFCEKKGQVNIEVLDTGLGMTKEQLKQLGQPYYTTKSDGTGLGLMVTFRLIESMGGALKFESELERGTTAKIRISGVKKEKELKKTVPGISFVD